MAMPSLSRSEPTGGGDMDLLKSLLENGSSGPSVNNNSQKTSASGSSGNTRASSRSSSSASSYSSRSRSRKSRSSRSRSRSRSRSNSRTFTYSNSNSDTENPTKKHSSPKEKQDSQQEDANKLHESTDEDTQSHLGSELSSLHEDVTTKKQPKSATKKKKKRKLKPRKTQQTDVIMETSKTESVISKQDSENQNDNDNSDKEEASSAAKKEKKKRRKKSSNTSHTPGHLYPEDLGGSDRLQNRYQELRTLVADQFIEHQEVLNRQIARGTRQVLSAERHRQQGYVGVVHPRGGGSGREVWVTHEPETTGTQVNPDDLKYRRRPLSAKGSQGYFLIDTTRKDRAKHVTFVREYDLAEEQEGSIISHEHKERTASRGRAVRRVAQPSPKRPLSGKLKQTNTAAVKPSPAKRREFSTSGSSPSRSRSSSRNLSSERIDHQLKFTDNESIKHWLKDKNKLIRQQKREKRKEERAKRKLEMETEQKRQVTTEKSTRQVDVWMKDKAKEARLLKKRQQQTNTVDMTDSSNKVVINRQVDLRSGTVQQDTEKCQEHESNTATRSNRKTIIVNTNGESFKCTCPAADVADKYRKKPTPPTKKKADTSQSGQPNARPTDPDKEGNESKRMSYNVWLKQKRKEDLLVKKKEKEKQERLLQDSDPESDAIVTGVARKRINNIMQGKKRVDTGIREIDDEANKSLDDKVSKEDPVVTQTGQVEEMSAGSSARFYRWVDDQEGEDSKRKRPVSAKVKSEKITIRSNKKRPSSAKANFQMTAERQSMGDQVSVPQMVSPRKSRNTSPKPRTPKSASYKSVKYQRKSWDDFSDHVWDKLNDEEGDQEETKKESEKSSENQKEAPATEKQMEDAKHTDTQKEETSESCPASHVKDQPEERQPSDEERQPSDGESNKEDPDDEKNAASQEIKEEADNSSEKEEEDNCSSEENPTNPEKTFITEEHVENGSSANSVTEEDQATEPPVIDGHSFFEDVPAFQSFPITHSRLENIQEGSEPTTASATEKGSSSSSEEEVEESETESVKSSVKDEDDDAELTMETPRKDNSDEEIRGVVSGVVKDYVSASSLESKVEHDGEAVKDSDV